MANPNSSYRFQSIRVRFSPSGILTSIRRAASTSTSSSKTDGRRRSYRSMTPTASPVDTINSVMSRQSSIVDLEEERRSFGSELNLLEPRPIVYWTGLEERLESDRQRAASRMASRLS